MSVTDQLKEHNINPDMLKAQIRYAVELIEPSLTAVDANGSIVLNNEKVENFCRAMSILLTPQSKVTEEISVHKFKTLQLVFDSSVAVLVGVYADMFGMDLKWQIDMIDAFMEWTLKEERRRNAE